MEWLALAVVTCAGASLLYFTVRTGISPMPSNLKQRAAILESASGATGPIYELGAGWGGLAFALADRFPASTVTAFELSWFPYAVMRVRQRLKPRSNLVLKREDFLKASLADGHLFVCYLFRAGMVALRTKLEREAPGAKLITHTFAVHGWTPEAEGRIDDLYRSRIYAYRIPRG